MNVLLWNCYRANKNLGEAQGQLGGIWILWNDNEVDLQIVKAESHFVCTKVVSDNQGFSVHVCLCAPFVYRWHPFWFAIHDEMSGVSEPLLIGCDFNYIMELGERNGGFSFLHNDSSIFFEVVNDLGLIDMGFSNQSFTWSKGNSASNLVSKRLNRVLMNTNVRLDWPKAYVYHLPKFSSDHTPLLLCMKPVRACNSRRRPFRFKVAWLTHPDFHPLTENNWLWNSLATRALTNLKQKLSRWNKETFRNIHKRKCLISQELEKVQRKLPPPPRMSLCYVTNTF
ncbi:hypothetical protein V2J09_000923 [Rumex salicifolius]